MVIMSFFFFALTASSPAAWREVEPESRDPALIDVFRACVRALMRAILPPHGVSPSCAAGCAPASRPWRAAP
jgi:hypothetical protein